MDYTAHGLGRRAPQEYFSQDCLGEVVPDKS